MHAPGVIVVGSYVQDHAWFCERFPSTGETVAATGFNTGPGGKGFNQAVACRRQGVSTRFAGAIGNDALGRIAQSFAESEQLDCRWETLGEVPTATSSIVVDASGANRIVVNLAANLHMDPEFAAAAVHEAADFRVLLVQLENNLDAIRAAAEMAARSNMLRVLNPAPVHADVDASLLALFDLITPNETEFSLLLERLGLAGLDDPASAADADLHAHARRIGTSSVVITLGSAGCFVSHSPQRAAELGEPAFYRLQAERVRAIDTTGAGDAFNGGLVAGLAQAGPVRFRDAVVHANRVAALSTERVGTAPAMPDRETVRQRFGD